MAGKKRRSDDKEVIEISSDSSGSQHSKRAKRAQSHGTRVKKEVKREPEPIAPPPDFLRLKNSVPPHLAGKKEVKRKPIGPPPGFLRLKKHVPPHSTVQHEVKIEPTPEPINPPPGFLWPRNSVAPHLLVNKEVKRESIDPPPGFLWPEISVAPRFVVRAPPEEEDEELRSTARYEGRFSELKDTASSAPPPLAPAAEAGPPKSKRCKQRALMRDPVGDNFKYLV